MTQLVRDEGVVLGRQDYMETDVLVTLFTRGHGKLRLVAKRARRISGESGAYLDLTNRVAVIYYSRRGLPLLKEASLVRSFPQIRADLTRAEAALQGLALAGEILPEQQPQPEAYRLLLSVLQALEGGGAARRILLSFGLHLVETLGYGPHLAGCVVCGATESLTWSGERGGLLCRECGGEGEVLSPAFWRYLLALQRLSVWAAGWVAMKEEEVEKAWDLFRQFLSYQLKR
ncbi:MAG: DNA repair protein RecO [Candidatus Bipolaricaulaceae bacterium]